MIDLTGVTHHPAIEEIVEVLCAKTQNTDRGFFNPVMAFFLAKMAGNMRAVISTKDRGDIPVNLYTLALATSGYGKGHSVNIIENEFMMGFKRRFVSETLPTMSDENLWRIANERAARDSTDPQEEKDKADTEYKRAGSFPYTFDSGTVPAVKQLRHKLLLANCGAINLQIDEIGLNLVGNVDLLTAFLELFDQGVIKNKLIKSTAENARNEEVDGKTPTNMMLFGTITKLFDGGQTEDQFYSMLETGYARRCLFGIGQQSRRAYHSQTPQEIYEKLIQPQNTAAVHKWAAHFHSLADPSVFGWRMEVPDDVAVLLIEYKTECEKAADLLPDHDEIRKAELSHRYFKALKLAGAYAFVDQSIQVDITHLKQAILLVEESGASFQSILTRPKSYQRLAKFIAEHGSELTHADLNEQLPFYKSGQAARNEMMTMAVAWGYKNHIIIKKQFNDGIEFFHGETLAETDLNKIKLSYSEHFAYNYETEEVPFEKLSMLTQHPDMSWCNHAFKSGHRAEENVIKGFNLIVIDVDGGISRDTVHELMREYKFHTYTTKRHTAQENRFRLIMPTNYVLTLDTDEYKEFMNSIMAWLPFTTDESANQRSKKWLSHDGDAYTHMDGELLDVLQFIPKTAKNEAYQKKFQEIESHDNLERWFAGRMASGNRNNQMIKFALALVDSGFDLLTVKERVHAFNNKLSNKLDAGEIDATIMRTVAGKFQRTNQGG